MLSIPKYPEQYAQHFPTIFYLLCCASQHHVMFSFSAGPLIHYQASVCNIFPVPLVFPFPTFSPTPHFPRGMGVFFWGGGYLCYIFPRIAFSAFSNPVFPPTQPIIFLN